MKIHGRHAVAYFATTGAAVPVGETSDLSPSGGADVADTTAQGQNFQSGIPGIPSFSVGLTKFYDDTYHELVDASISGTPGTLYLYPDRRNATVYFANESYVGMDSWSMAVGDAEAQGFTLTPATDTQYIHP